ncbi:hypothetical protein DL93DRAFT_2099160 [Clavulina sp. PMI_390]|nr:hypothetical protein DL93DRAFT_2099160 [Clavulina sp. PMI_390]
MKKSELHSGHGANVFVTAVASGNEIGARAVAAAAPLVGVAADIGAACSSKLRKTERDGRMSVLQRKAWETGGELPTGGESGAQQRPEHDSAGLLGKIDDGGADQGERRNKVSSFGIDPVSRARGVAASVGKKKKGEEEYTYEDQRLGWAGACMGTVEATLLVTEVEGSGAKYARVIEWGGGRAIAAEEEIMDEETRRERKRSGRVQGWVGGDVQEAVTGWARRARANPSKCRTRFDGPNTNAI